MKNITSSNIPLNVSRNIRSLESPGNMLPYISGEKDTILKRLIRNEEESPCVRVRYEYRSPGIGLDMPVRTKITEEISPCLTSASKEPSEPVEMCERTRERRLPGTRIIVKQKFMEECKKQTSWCVIL
jgi:hypothetical protein